MYRHPAGGEVPHVSSVRRVPANLLFPAASEMIDLTSIEAAGGNTSTTRHADLDTHIVSPTQAVATYAPMVEAATLSCVDENMPPLLAWPSQYAGEVFKRPVSFCGIQSDGRQSCWGQPRLWGREDRLVLAGVQYVQKTYRGPVYLPGASANHYSWATIHALQVADASPPEHLAEALRNAAPQEGMHGWLGVAAAAAIVSTHDTSVAFDVPPLADIRRPSATEIAQLIQVTIDANGSLIASVKTNRSRAASLGYHAVCIAGYRVCNGHMDIQVLDSECGEGAITLEGLVGELQNSDHGSLVTVAKR